MVLTDCVRNVGQWKIRVHKVLSDRTGIIIAIGRKRCAGAERDADDSHESHPHASPPARSALGVRGPEPRPSIFLYHDISAAVAIIAAMPKALTATCIRMPFDTSTRTKCAAKARNTPAQKISREC